MCLFISRSYFLSLSLLLFLSLFLSKSICSSIRYFLSGPVYENCVYTFQGISSVKTFKINCSSYPLAGEVTTLPRFELNLRKKIPLDIHLLKELKDHVFHESNLIYLIVGDANFVRNFQP